MVLKWPTKINIDKVVEKSSTMQLQYYIEKEKDFFILSKYNECIKLKGKNKPIQFVVDRYGNWIVLEDKEKVLTKEAFKQIKKIYNDIFKAMSI